MLISDGFLIREEKNYNMHLNQLKVIRWVGALIYNSNVKKGFQKDPEQLLSLPEFNMEGEKAKTTKEEALEILKKLG